MLGVSLEPANPQRNWFEHPCPVPVLDPVQCGLPPFPRPLTLKGKGR